MQFLPIHFSLYADNEDNLVDEGAEDFKPNEPQSKAESRGILSSNHPLLQHLLNELVEAATIGRHPRVDNFFPA